MVDMVPEEGRCRGGGEVGGRILQEHHVLDPYSPIMLPSTLSTAAGCCYWCCCCCCPCCTDTMRSPPVDSPYQVSSTGTTPPAVPCFPNFISVPPKPRLLEYDILLLIGINMSEFDAVLSYRRETRRCITVGSIKEASKYPWYVDQSIVLASMHSVVDDACIVCWYSIRVYTWC